MRYKRGVLFSALLWTALAAIAALAVGYGVFWLPYQHPEKVMSPELKLLRQADAIPDAGVEKTEGHEWVDREKRIVRIPVEDAMTIVAEKLPVRKKGAAK